MTDTVTTEIVADSTVSIETVEIATALVEVIEIALQGPRGVQGTDGPAGPAGIQGIQGIQGPAGGSIPQFTAGENLSGHRAIRLHNGLAYYCDSATLAHAGTAIGITTGAASIGDLANVQTMGNMSEPSWSWIEGPVFVGTNGQLSQLQTGYFMQQIGVAASATELNINPQSAVIRSL